MEIHPYVAKGNSSLIVRHSVMEIHPYDRWLNISVSNSALAKEPLSVNFPSRYFWVIL